MPEILYCESCLHYIHRDKYVLTGLCSNPKAVKKSGNYVSRISTFPQAQEERENGNCGVEGKNFEQGATFIPVKNLARERK